MEPFAGAVRKSSGLTKPTPLLQAETRSRLGNALDLVSREREQAVLSDFRHRLLNLSAD
jgi:hypothetical protein